MTAKEKKFLLKALRDELKDSEPYLEDAVKRSITEKAFRDGIKQAIGFIEDQVVDFDSVDD